MPMTSIVASQLAAVAAAIRADRGYSTWDIPGITAQLRKVAHLELPDVAMAVIRAASDPNARTPGVIPRMDAPHWRERITDPDKPTRIPRDQVCRSCGRHQLHPVHRPGAPSDVDDPEAGYHPWVSLDAPRGAPPPENLRQIVADARPVCNTPPDDVQHTTDTTEEAP